MEITGKQPRVARIKDGLQVFLLIFGASFGVYTFVYRDIILVSRRPPAVTLAATLDELDRADGMILIRAHLVVTNRSEAKVWVPALWWNVYGVSFEGLSRTTAEFASEVRPLLESLQESHARFSDLNRVEVVATGRVADYEYWYQPNDETVNEQLFLVPETGFDALQIFVNATITKSIEEFAPTRWEIRDDGELVPTLMLKEPGWDTNHSSRVTMYDDVNRSHRRMSERSDAGQNATTASLRIRPKASLRNTAEQDERH